MRDKAWFSVCGSRPGFQNKNKEEKARNKFTLRALCDMISNAG